MVYYTPAFKDVLTDPILYVEYLIEGANEVFKNSRVPLKLKGICVEELDVTESANSQIRLLDFLYAKSNLTALVEMLESEDVEGVKKLAAKPLLNTADIAVLVMATTVDKSSGWTGGRAAGVGPTQIVGEPPLAWVSAGVKHGFTHDYANPVQLFTHEVGHLLGCLHNGEAGDGGLGNETSRGYLVEGSNYLTAMAYPTQYHNVWIPYFSGKDLTYEGLPIGNAMNDNRRTLMENRFLVSEFGDESGYAGTCSKIVTSCAGMCLQEGAAPPNFSYRDSEIWCRYNCMLPMSGYFNLQGEAVGFGFDYLHPGVQFAVWLPAIMILFASVACVKVCVVIQVVDPSYIPPEELWLCG